MVIGSKPDLVAQLALVRPSVALLPSYLGLIEEMRAQGETIWPSRIPVADERPGAFFARLLSKETNPEPQAIAGSAQWGVAGGQVVGVIALRHRLNERLSQFGGHVGYEVRP